MRENQCLTSGKCQVTEYPLREEQGESAFLSSLGTGA